jgi:hypothetical protein
MVEEVLEKYGRLDILVNNLGGSETPGSGFVVLTDEDWEATFFLCFKLSFDYFQRLNQSVFYLKMIFQNNWTPLKCTRNFCCQFIWIGNEVPSLHSHYRNFITTTDCSVPVLRIGTLSNVFCT